MDGRQLGFLKAQLTTVEVELRHAVQLLVRESERRYPRTQHVARLTEAIDKHKVDRQVLQNRIAEASSAYIDTMLTIYS